MDCKPPGQTGGLFYTAKPPTIGAALQEKRDRKDMLELSLRLELKTCRLQGGCSAN